MLRRVTGFCRFSLTIRWRDLATRKICALVKDPASCIHADAGSDDDDKKAVAEAFEQSAREAVANSLWAELIVGNLTTLKDKVLDASMRMDASGCRLTFLPDGTLVDRTIVAWRRLDPLSANDPAVASPGMLGTIQIDFAISQQCLLAQAAQALSAMVIPVRDGQQQRAGSAGMPCRGFGIGSTIYGDWDMAQRNLIRSRSTGSAATDKCSTLPTTICATICSRSIAALRATATMSSSAAAAVRATPDRPRTALSIAAATTIRSAMRSAISAGSC
jgi:hypothetical protein